MNLKKIKEIIELPLISDNEKESLVIDEISNDEEVISHILMILTSERQRKHKLINEMNVLLSKADIGLREPKLNENGFMQEEITEFYKSSELNHCFKSK